MRLLFISIILISSSYVNAQQTYVPDDNFEAYLENNGMGNGTPNDDYVTTSNISGVTSLIVWGWNIADLTGIEDFAALSTLYCFDNPLGSLDLSQNTALTEVRCYSAQLTTLDVSNSPGLSILFCFDNLLTSLDVTQNPALNELRCFTNPLGTLDVSQNPSLSLLFCYNNLLSAIDVTQNTMLNDFRCFDNNISILDVSQNTALTTLFCYDNQITSLDVTQSTSLNELFCYINDLTALDVTQNTALTDLRCNNNQITSLNVSQNTAMVTLMCNDNQLECLNANNGQNISLFCQNNLLDCISVVYPPWTFANAGFDNGVTFNVSCQPSINNDIVQVGTSLSAEQNGASYQWLNCDIMDGVISGATSQTYTPTITGYYSVEITLTDPCGGGVLIDTSSCHLVDYSGIEELINGTVELIRIVDLLGRDTPFKSNTPLIYIYSDGTTERIFKLEE